MSDSSTSPPSSRSPSSLASLDALVDKRLDAKRDHANAKVTTAAIPRPNAKLPSKPPAPPMPIKAAPNAPGSVEELEATELEDDIDFPSIDKTQPFQRAEILAAAEKLSPTPAAGRPPEDVIPQQVQTSTILGVPPPPAPPAPTTQPTLLPKPPLPVAELTDLTDDAEPQDTKVMDRDQGTQPTLESLTDDEQGPGDTVILPRSPLGSSKTETQKTTRSSLGAVAVDATLRLPAQRADASLPRTPMANTGLIWAISGGVAAFAAIAIVMVAIMTGDDSSRSSTTTTTAGSTAAGSSASASPRTADHGIRSAVIETPESAAQKNPAAPGEPVAQAAVPTPTTAIQDAPTTTPAALAAAPPPPPVHTTAPAPAPVTPKETKEKTATAPPATTSKAKTAPSPTTPPPPPQTQAAAPPPPPRPAAPPATTGTVIVPESMMTITVDGEYRRVSGGRVVVTCGQHRITAGIKGTQNVNVPCGGAVSL